MLGVSIKPVMRFVARHGIDITHRRVRRAATDAPWQPDDSAAVGEAVILKGLIQQVKSAPGEDDVATASFRSVAVIALPRGASRPLPGDTLEADGQTWRVENILPLARHRSGELLEARLISYGSFRT